MTKQCLFPILDKHAECGVSQCESCIHVTRTANKQAIVPSGLVPFMPWLRRMEFDSRRSQGIIEFLIGFPSRKPSSEKKECNSLILLDNSEANLHSVLAVALTTRERTDIARTESDDAFKFPGLLTEFCTKLGFFAVALHGC